MKYKKGDKVMVLPTILSDITWCEDGVYHFLVGKTVTITGIDVGNNFYHVDNNRYGINFREEYLGPVHITNWRARIK